MQESAEKQQAENAKKVMEDLEKGKDEKSDEKEEKKAEAE